MKLHIPDSVNSFKVNHPVQRNRYPASPVFTSHPIFKPKQKVNEQKKKP